jgi:hypothetical protein
LEDSNIILADMHAVSMGEQKLGPFPHYTLSTRTEGLFYPQVSLPVSDWFVDNKIAQSIESGHNIASIYSLVDAYYQMGALVNLYGHNSSAYGLMNVFMHYSLTKPRMWAANSVEIADWWALRSKVTVIPVYQVSGAQVVVTATVSGASDPDTAIELVIPHWNPAVTGRLQVLINGAPASGDRYRFTSYGIKIKVGSDVSAVEVRFTARTDLWQANWRYMHAK